jgi:undecaprenyl pyrophosphate phosphatase UppP
MTMTLNREVAYRFSFLGLFPTSFDDGSMGLESLVSFYLAVRSPFGGFLA